MLRLSITAIFLVISSGSLAGVSELPSEIPKPPAAKSNICEISGVGTCELPNPQSVGSACSCEDEDGNYVPGTIQE